MADPMMASGAPFVVSAKSTPAQSPSRQPDTLRPMTRVLGLPQVRSYFGTWAASRAKTIFAILNR
jgi:hypothetical protein